MEREPNSVANATVPGLQLTKKMARNSARIEDAAGGSRESDKASFAQMRERAIMGKEHIANIEQTWYMIIVVAARLSRSRIPAIRSTYYVRHCPAYRRRFLHG